MISVGTKLLTQEQEHLEQEISSWYICFFNFCGGASL